MIRYNDKKELKCEKIEILLWIHGKEMNVVELR